MCAGQVKWLDRFDATLGPAHKWSHPIARADTKGSIIMTHYGKIHSYDADKGAGMITPDKGGDALPFAKADLQQQAEEPKADQRYGYETKQGEGGTAHAINLQMEQGDSADSDGSNQVS